MGVRIGGSLVNSSSKLPTSVFDCYTKCGLVSECGWCGVVWCVVTPTILGRYGGFTFRASRSSQFMPKKYGCFLISCASAGEAPSRFLGSLFKSYILEINK